MSSDGFRCGLATNVLWKAVPGSRTCIREGPLAEVAVHLSCSATRQCFHNSINFVNLRLSFGFQVNVVIQNKYNNNWNKVERMMMMMMIN